jgi:anti-anti-sigma factor
MEITHDNYRVTYEEDGETITFKGSLRLGGMEEYRPIATLLAEVAEKDIENIILDLKGLEFLNSSGIGMLSKFVIEIRKKNSTRITVKASESIPWQGKSLKNLQRLMPGLSLEFTA